MRSICSKLPEEQKGEACELLKMMYAEPLIEDKIPLIVNILSKFSYQLDMITHQNRIEDKLDNVKFDIFKTKLNNSNIISNLYAIKKQLEELNEVESVNALSIEKLNSNQAKKLNGLNNDILERLDEIKSLINDLPKNNDTQEFYNNLNELKQLKSDIVLQELSAITSLIGFSMQLYQQYGPV